MPAPGQFTTDPDTTLARVMSQAQVLSNSLYRGNGFCARGAESAHGSVEQRALGDRIARQVNNRCTGVRAWPQPWIETRLYYYDLHFGFVMQRTTRAHIPARDGRAPLLSGTRPAIYFGAIGGTALTRDFPIFESIYPGDSFGNPPSDFLHFSGPRSLTLGGLLGVRLHGPLRWR